MFEIFQSFKPLLLKNLAPVQPQVRGEKFISVFKILIRCIELFNMN